MEPVVVRILVIGGKAVCRIQKIVRDAHIGDGIVARHPKSALGEHLHGQRLDPAVHPPVLVPPIRRGIRDHGMVRIALQIDPAAEELGEHRLRREIKDERMRHRVVADGVTATDQLPDPRDTETLRGLASRPAHDVERTLDADLLQHGGLGEMARIRVVPARAERTRRAAGQRCDNGLCGRGIRRRREGGRHGLRVFRESEGILREACRPCNHHRSEGSERLAFEGSLHRLSRIVTGISRNRRDASSRAWSRAPAPSPRRSRNASPRTSDAKDPSPSIRLPAPAPQTTP